MTVCRSRRTFEGQTLSSDTSACAASQYQFSPPVGRALSSQQRPHSSFYLPARQVFISQASSLDTTSIFIHPREGISFPNEGDSKVLARLLFLMSARQSHHPSTNPALTSTILAHRYSCFSVKGLEYLLQLI